MFGGSCAHGSTYLGFFTQKAMIGGWCDTSVKELHVTPLFRAALLVVTTTTGYCNNVEGNWKVTMTWKDGNRRVKREN